MRKLEAKRGFQSFVESQEALEAKNYQKQSCSKTEMGDEMSSTVSTSSIDSSTKEDSDLDSDSSQSFSSTLSSDLMEDSNSSSSSASSSSNGPLYQLSDLMAQLPIKRGLSKYYQGKSQSFASLASVENLEDLAKRENPYRKRIKLCDSQKFCKPKKTISKKTCYSRGCFASSALARNTTNNLLSS